MAITSYDLIIDLSIILIISFFFGEISKRTSIPSVLLLILLGVFSKILLDYFSIGDINFFPILEVLGIVGLIMIVLEAALELKLEREKMIPIVKSFIIALLSLLISTWVTAEILYFFIDGMDKDIAWLYATPLSILSSAIIIPSVNGLRADKKEFHIYESTFSDILGIMLFYFLIGRIDSDHDTQGFGGSITQFGITTLVTIVLSLVSSYLVIFIFQRIKSNVKLFLLISVLMLLYALGKKMHLSSLIIILIFGLMIANVDLFFRGFLKKFIDHQRVKAVYHGLHEITMETAFVVRTFFFVVFGITITFDSLASINVLAVSALLIFFIYAIRYIILRPSIGVDIQPQLFIAPRGLITILLFYAIPHHLNVEGFSQGILLYIIIGTSIIMTYALLANKRKKNKLLYTAENNSVKSVKWKAPIIEESSKH